jgi:imidazolonepropionase-like amidohydrolase
MHKQIPKFILACLTLIASYANSQPANHPVNGIRDVRDVVYAITNATIISSATDTIVNGTILIREGKIIALGDVLETPADAVVLDVRGKWVYPAFTDPFSNYGIPKTPEKERPDGPQIESSKKGPYSWNEALHPEVKAHLLFTAMPDSAKKYREAGFANSISFSGDGIARGTAVAVSLGNRKDNELIIKKEVAACYSFSKGSSIQNYPGSQMGAIALLRQTWYDAEWYNVSGHKEFYDASLEKWNHNLKLTPYFEAGNKYEILRAASMGDEFGVDFIFKGTGDEYQRAAEISRHASKLVIPVNLPEKYDLSDPYDAINVSLADLKHWELAAHNARILDSLGVKLAFTSGGLSNRSDFIKNIRKMISAGLDKRAALEACTVNPANWFGLGEVTGKIKEGMNADFLITTGDIFTDNTRICENWAGGERLIMEDATLPEYSGKYDLNLKNNQQYILEIFPEKNGEYISYIGTDSLKTKVAIRREGDKLNLVFYDSLGDINIRLIGSAVVADPMRLEGKGIGEDDIWFDWTAIRTSDTDKADDTSTEPEISGAVYYPNKSYGFEKRPVAGDLVIRNATVWTNGTEGTLEQADVLIISGKIAAVGMDIDTGVNYEIDGTGMHLTPGIIDEHSHIAISGGVNECTQSSTAEVRIGDVINADDINIYRQLSGGVTAAQLLHGSCNPIGGQSALIKLRWGSSPDEMKIEGADNFIKFALGENVKQSNWGDKHKIRYPQTRMGVEQTYFDAFTRAREYMNSKPKRSQGYKDGTLRRDLEMDALSEILKAERFITCHSYQQGEINMLMHVGDSMGFRVNTFTHILEGYKVADKMKAHGAGASTFSDWWAYKYEVIEAIPYNGAILNRMGVVTAINSDDAEMGRRLNQEAAKAIKYGGLSEEEALKFVTLNPAKLLHLDHRMGSISKGKDADLVLWSGHPLSVYSVAEYTFVDGVLYYSRTSDNELRERDQKERQRLVRKMLQTKGNGTKLPSYTEPENKHCINEEDLLQ